MDTLKPPILDDESRQPRPMSRKVLLAALGGAAAVGTIVVGCETYRPAPVESNPNPTPAPMRVVPLAGVTVAYPTKWATTQPASGETPKDSPPPANPEGH